MAPTTFKASPYLIVEPATLLQGGQISLCDSQFESSTQNKVRITLSQRTTHSCCHILDNQFTQGLRKYTTLVQDSNNTLQRCAHLGELRYVFLTVSWGRGVCRQSARRPNRRGFSVHQAETDGNLGRKVHFSCLFLLYHKRLHFSMVSFDCFGIHFSIFALMRRFKAEWYRVNDDIALIDRW